MRRRKREAKSTVTKVLPGRAWSYRRVEAELERLTRSYRPPGRPWTPQEERLVKRFYGRVRIADLSKRLGRSHASVEHYVKRMRLRGVRLECDRRR